MVILIVISSLFVSAVTVKKSTYKINFYGNFTDEEKTMFTKHIRSYPPNLTNGLKTINFYNTDYSWKMMTKGIAGRYVFFIGRIDIYLGGIGSIDHEISHHSLFMDKKKVLPCNFNHGDCFQKRLKIVEDAV